MTNIKNIICLVSAAVLLCGFTGCSNVQNDSSAISESANENGFDIERARKKIVIKGQTIEIPVKLGEIPEGWSYKLYDR